MKGPGFNFHSQRKRRKEARKETRKEEGGRKEKEEEKQGLGRAGRKILNLNVLQFSPLMSIV